MIWLISIIISYFFFAFASLGDKIVLAGPAKPKSYTFFVGILSIISVLIIPFVDFGFPSGENLVWIILEAVVYVAGLYAFFYALENFEVSRIVPTIGATQPVFIGLLSLAFWGFQPVEARNIIAFIVLLAGSVLISIDKDPKITRKSLEIGILTSLLFSLDFVFSKFVFLGMDFWPGFIWMRILSFVIVLVFLFDKSFRREIAEDSGASKKTGVLFLVTQASGGAANILQSLSISLAPVAYLAIINSMKGIQYVFLFLMVVLVSHFLPKVLKEEMDKRVVLQKIVSIIIIGLGLAILIA